MLEVIECAVSCLRIFVLFVRQLSNPIVRDPLLTTPRGNPIPPKDDGGFLPFSLLLFDVVDKVGKSVVVDFIVVIVTLVRRRLFQALSSPL